MNFLQTLASHYRNPNLWQQKAWNMVQTKGFPDRKWEGFRYVPLHTLYNTTFPPPDKSTLFIKRQRDTCIFVNGKFQPELSQVNAKIVCLPLHQAMRSYGALLTKNWSQSLKEESNPFHLLNHALYETALFIYIPPKTQTSIKWLFLSTKGTQIHTPKMEIYLGKRAHLTIRSEVQGQEQYWHNESFSAYLDQEASLCLEEEISHSDHSWGFHTKRVQLNHKATFHCTTLSKGAKIERHDISVVLGGEQSKVDVKGLSLLSKNNEIHHHLLINHKKAHTHSNQLYKNVLQGESRSSFEGKIIVEKEAQKTEAYQLNNNLLLSTTAHAMSKPNLSIMADDVKASHGATCSQLKADEMFYLKSRGLREEEAKRILIKGFCHDFLFNEELLNARF